MREDILKRQDEIEEWVKEEKPLTFIMANLRCTRGTMLNAFNKLGISYHGNKHNHNTSKKTMAYYKTQLYVDGRQLKKKLLEEGIKEDKCEICGLSCWNGKKLVLEVHHIDGNHYNNKIKNLLLVCPNCHSQC